MTIDQLRNAILIDSGNFHLTADVLSYIEISDLLDNHITNGTIRDIADTMDITAFTMTSASITSTAVFVRVEGQANLLSTIMTAVATFSLDMAGDPILELTCEPPVGWNIEDSFIGLQDTYFVDLTWTGVLFSYLSRAQGAMQFGLNFKSDFQLPVSWQQLQWFADPGVGATLSGPITIINGQPEAILEQSPPPISPDIGGYLDVDFTMQHIINSIPDARNPSQSIVTAYAQLKGNISYMHGGTNVVVPIRAMFGSPLDTLQFEFETASSYDIAFSEITQWLGGKDLGVGLPVFGNPLDLQLESLGFMIGLRTQQLESATLSIQSTTTWIVIPGILEIKDIEFYFMLLNPGAGGRLIATIQGVALLGGVELELYAEAPSYRIGGNLVEGTAPNLRQLFNEYPGIADDLATNLTITDLQFSAYESGSSFEIFMQLGVDIYGFPFEANFKRYEDGTLSFRATAGSEEGISFLSLAGAFLPDNIHIPNGILDVLIQQTSVQIEGGAGDWLISVDGAIAIEVGDEIEFLGFKFGVTEALSFPFHFSYGTAGSDRPGSYFSFGMDIMTNQSLYISTNLAWNQSIQSDSLGPDPVSLREIQNNTESSTEDLLKLELTVPPLADPSAPPQKIRLIIIERNPSSINPTRFFNRMHLLDEHDNPIPTGTGFDPALVFILNVNPGGSNFQFPFLKQDSIAAATGFLSQSISVGNGGEFRAPFTIPEVEEGEPVERLITMNVPVTVSLDSINLTGNFPLQFNIDKLAASIDHQQGIQLVSNIPEIAPQPLLGLQIKFKGAIWRNPDGTEKRDTDGNLQYHYLSLSTSKLNYQLQKAPDAVIELQFSELSNEPIIFRATEFIISKKGLTLTAEVADNPVRINGINTQFRFGGTRLQIVENKIQDFTLQGSGALPPDLVGDAQADISIQFKTINDKLQPVAGAARIKGKKVLDCKGTRFQFSLDSLGLKFVREQISPTIQKSHFYFTLTGQAKFVPAAGDDQDGPLALLPEVSLDLVDCPLTGDARVLSKHIKFLVEFPKPIGFSFLGAYGFELRAIGFVPQCEKFDGRGAMLLSGQVFFAKGVGDILDPRPDLHNLYIGLPPKGRNKPVISMSSLPVQIGAGSKFRLSGAAKFEFSSDMQGFLGNAVLEIKGLPPIAAALGFMRIRRSATEPWQRAWFIYVEIRQISFEVPELKFFLREVGLGFGYRFTLLAINQADESQDLQQMIQELEVTSRTQGDLSKFKNWAVDFEEEGEDPRWTIVIRAMFSQLTAATSPLKWNEMAEEKLPSAFLFDAVLAIRSDLTFFMNARGWINTSYGRYNRARRAGHELEPLFSGFMFLWPREKRLLAHLSSNSNGHLGTIDYPLNPPLDPFTKIAIRNSDFSATLLIEPHLMHLEMGWPNMMRFSHSIGPFEVERRGGFIFRITDTEMLMGISFKARATLDIDVEVDLAVVGAVLEAKADAAYGGRLAGLISYDSPVPLIYGAVGIELRLDFELTVWIGASKHLAIEHTFDFDINFTAGLEIGYIGDDQAGLKGKGEIALEVLGHELTFEIDIKHNKEAVEQAKAAVAPFTHLSLEASDSGDISVPGVDGGHRAMTASSPMTAGIPQSGDASLVAFAPGFNMPDYSVFIIRNAADGYHYFVLFPQGEKSPGIFETGFLPAPPQSNPPLASIPQDFKLEFPIDEDYELSHFNPISEGWQDHNIQRDFNFSWRAKWDSTVITDIKGAYKRDATLSKETPPPNLKLQEYITQAFLLENNQVELDLQVPLGDPPPFLSQLNSIRDERVDHPNDDAYDAAVRGAAEQFRGSPYFKRDPNFRYEIVLEQAFDDNTSIFESDIIDKKQNQHAHQIRGLIIHDIVNDLKNYVDAHNSIPGESEAQIAIRNNSIPFQLGLVFRTKDMPDWLFDGGDSPIIRQRLGPSESDVSSTEQGELIPFNLNGMDFSVNPPKFDSVKSFASSSTISIKWDLKWESIPGAPGLVGCQAEPDHHLAYYQVRRRPLDGRSPEVNYRVKNATVLQKDVSAINVLKPRFQLVDHFNDETLEEQAGLPASGRSYLYSITPMDYAGKIGLPLSIVVTRFPDDPPPVPVDATIKVLYRFDTLTMDTDKPILLEPEPIQLYWTQPKVANTQVKIPVDDYCLLFRREKILPIGSYGLDSETQRNQRSLLPTSNARALPSDIKIVVQAVDDPNKKGGKIAEVDIADLRAAGVFPKQKAGRTIWQPEAWRVFIQTKSVNGVFSALAPVQILLNIARNGIPKIEERRPSELEWLPKPYQMPILPPEDQLALTGTSHFPMPAADFLFDGTVNKVSYQALYNGTPLVRFKWNQGPSANPNYPLSLTGGFHLLELDIDAHPKSTFDDQQKLNEAIRPIQEILMTPKEGLLQTPGDTLNTSLWEAWYPSKIQRQLDPDDISEGAELAEGNWYSWRESILDWPEWDGLTNGEGIRRQPFHPLLTDILQSLRLNYLVDAQTSPPYQPTDWTGFMETTAGEIDPYGWGIMQRLGLSTTFSLRHKTNGKIISGQAMLDIVQEHIRSGLKTRFEKKLADANSRIVLKLTTNTNYHDLLVALDDLETDLEDSSLSTAQKEGLKNDISITIDTLLSSHLDTFIQEDATIQYLFVSLLIQASKKTGLEAGSTLSENSLLATVQLSLRPKTRQIQKYWYSDISGNANTEVDISIGLNGETSLSLIDWSDPTYQQQEIVSDLSIRIIVPANGQTRLLFRCPTAPTIIINGTGNTVSEFAAASPQSAFFNVSSDQLANLFSTSGNICQTHWLRFKAYLQALNAQLPDGPQLDLPIDEAALKKTLPEFLLWSKRFFDHSHPEMIAGSSLQTWLVTAYLRVDTPAYTAPNAAGHIQYDHVISNQWAHNYRYYLRPYSRYQQLWNSLILGLYGPTEYANLRAPALVLPNEGALDVVIDRSYPLEKPLIISSGRLDLPGTAAAPSPPGKIWEVLIAQHPEQSLMEYNVTLARQLSFRQIAYTLLRGFIFSDWMVRLGYSISQLEIPGQTSSVLLPTNFQESPDPASLTLEQQEERALQMRPQLALPNRLGSFSERALALQWDALPFYYEHKLKVIAQAASVVSKINEIQQSDFEYRAPTPEAVWYSEPNNKVIEVTLKTLWHSLPLEAQSQWPMENPVTVSTLNKIRPGGIPDLIIVYQIIEIFDGNIEVQAQLSFNFDNNLFELKQLGKQVIFDEANVEAFIPSRLAADSLFYLKIRTVNDEVFENRNLYIMALRGSASPSPMEIIQPITILP